MLELILLWIIKILVNNFLDNLFEIIKGQSENIPPWPSTIASFQKRIRSVLQIKLRPGPG